MPRNAAYMDDAGRYFDAQGNEVKPYYAEDAMRKLGFDPTIKDRPAILPDYRPDVGFVAPQIGVDMLKALMLPGHVAQGGDWNMRDASDMALALAGQGGAAGMAAAPAGGLAMGASKRGIKSLPMDEASRMARAMEMGFDVENPIYHGTHAGGFKSFDLDKSGSGAWGDVYQGTPDRAIFFASNKSHAENYGPSEKYVARGNFLKRDIKKELEDWAKSEGYESAQKMIDAYEGNLYRAASIDEAFMESINEAKKLGYDGVKLLLGDLKGKHNTSGDLFAIFDPKNIRLYDAVFDPTKKNSADLLASNMSPLLSAPMVIRDEKKK